MKFSLLFLWLVSVSLFSFGQKKRCGSDEVNLLRIQQNPTLLETRRIQEMELQHSISNFSKKRLNITIPVVVHVVYYADNENISNEQIYSQITALNRDFNNLNSDTLKSNHPFYSLVGNIGLKFELAGITRTKTNKVNWGDADLNNDNMKSTATGGIENWNPKKYLNIYTVRFADEVQLLGYAYFPEDLASYPQTDGVVVDFRSFGTQGTSGIEGFAAYNLGRTVTHEVGHWLGLRHIWGDLVYDTDKQCGDDLVSDTPPAEGDNSGVPTFPHRPNNRCGSDANGEMYMDYMDYVHDKAMVMFTKGQVTRMTSSINTYRKDLLKYTPVTVKVNSVSINTPNNDTIFKLSNGTIQLSTSVLPQNATNKTLNWSCTPNTVAKIDQNGKITIINSGQFTITAQSIDGSLIISKKVLYIVDEKTNLLNENTQNLLFSIHPNPASDMYYITTNALSEGKVRIYDLVGKICLENHFSPNQNEYSLSDLEVGNYIVEIDVLGQVARTKLIKK